MSPTLEQCGCATCTWWRTRDKGCLVAPSVSVRMVVGFQLLLQIADFLLYFLDLLFECFDPLVIVWMMVTVLCLGHLSSLKS